MRQKPGFAQMLIIRFTALKKHKPKIKINARLCAYSWLAANVPKLCAGVELELCPPGTADDYKYFVEVKT